MLPKSNINVVLVLFGTLAIVSLVEAQNNHKNSTRPECNKKKVDICSARLIMLGDRTFAFPESSEEMQKRCKEIKPLEKCLKDYTSRCLPHASASTMSVLAYGISKTNKGYCSNNRRRMSFVAFGNCVNANKKDLDHFMDKMSGDFHAIVNYKDPKLRIPLACCSYFTFKNRVLNTIGKKCDEHSAEVEALIDGYAHDILNLVCGEYTEESNKCRTIDSKTPTWKGTLKTKSFVHPLADIFESL